MSDPLVTCVRRNRETLFAIYEHWGAGTGGEFETMCNVLGAIDDRNADLETLIRQTISALPDGAGLLDHKSWFANTDDYNNEYPRIKQMLDSGIKACTSRNDGLIAFTPKAMDALMNNACDVQQIDLDGENCLIDCLECKGDEDNFKAELHDEAYDDEEYEELTEDIRNAEALPVWATENVVRENAKCLLEKWNGLLAELFVSQGGTYYRVFCS